MLQNPLYESLNVLTNIHENPALENQMYESFFDLPATDSVLFTGWEPTLTPVGLFSDPETRHSPDERSLGSDE
jgi:hypothetical protein